GRSVRGRRPREGEAPAELCRWLRRSAARPPPRIRRGVSLAATPSSLPGTGPVANRGRDGVPDETIESPGDGPPHVRDGRRASGRDRDGGLARGARRALPVGDRNLKSVAGARDPRRQGSRPRRDHAEPPRLVAVVGLDRAAPPATAGGAALTGRAAGFA